MKTLTEKVAKRLDRYRNETPLDKDALRELLQRGYRHFTAASQESEHADAPLGMRLYHAFELLLDRTLAPEDWPTVQAAAHYLVDPDDAVDDLESEVGMLDDAEVFNDLCTALGYSDLRVAP